MATSPAIDSVPELVEGDRLGSAEFERRYHASAVRKAELIEGVVRVASPVLEQHGSAHSSAHAWITFYRLTTPNLASLVDGTVRLDGSNQVQPDIQLRIAPAAGGRSIVGADGYVEGPPELVIEIALSSASRDLGEKLEVYRRAGVLEYLVWRVEDGAVDWFALRDGDYQRLTPDAAGIIKSGVFSGLWLDVEALIRGDLAALNAAVQAGLATAEHAAFAARLAAAGRRP